MFKKIILSLVLFMALPVSSWAMVHVAAVGAANMAGFEASSTGAIATTSTYTANLGLGGGVLLDLGVAPMWTVELGALYLATSASATVSGTKHTYSGTVLQVPLLGRLWFGPMFSIGLGGYYSAAIGELTHETKTGGAAAVSTSHAYGNFGLKENDYGATVSIGIYLPIGAMMKLVLDGRYNMGLANTSSVATQKVKNNSTLALVGVQFGF